MSKILDIIKSDGEWLCEEDKEPYTNRVKSNGNIGYATNIKAILNTIHPLKRKLSKNPFNESYELSTTMIVGAPEYDSIDGSSSAHSL